MTILNVLSLFSGIGGLELGLERAGMTVVGQVEINPYARSVLARHWPKVPRHDDVHTAIDWWRSEPRPPVHMVAGGFPCQPVSEAGKRLAQDDERWLWPDMVAVILALQPRWVLWENVSGLLTRGLDIVHTDLVRAGYRHRVGWATACSVGAPHMRRRLLGVAHTTSHRRDRIGSTGPQTPPMESPRRGPQPGRPWTTQPRPVGVAHGIPRGMDRRRALGNAVVPLVSEHIGRLVVACEHNRAAA